MKYLFNFGYRAPTPSTVAPAFYSACFQSPLGGWGLSETRYFRHSGGNRGWGRRASPLSYNKDPHQPVVQRSTDSLFFKRINRNILYTFGHNRLLFVTSIWVLFLREPREFATVELWIWRNVIVAVLLFGLFRRLKPFCFNVISLKQRPN